MNGHNHIDEIAALETVFRDEARELLDRLETCLLDLERGVVDRELVESAFRHLHTLKGIAGMYGFDRLSAVAHALESFFEEARRSTDASVPDGAVRTSLESLDCMRALSEVRGTEIEVAARAQADQLLAQLTAAPAPVTTESSPCEEAQPLTDMRLYRMALTPGADAFLRGLRPEAILNELCSLGECDVRADLTRLPALEKLDPGTLYLSWGVELKSAAPPERVREALMFLHADEFSIECESADDGDGGGEGEQYPDRRGSDDRRLGSRRTSDSGADDIVRVQARRLDQLVDMVGELVTAQGALATLTTDSTDVRLASVAEVIGRLVGDLRESVLDIRMVPIGTLFGRFRRHVRDLADELGKEVEIVAEGAETELDKGVLDRIGEPVLHMLRNCLDHGIEPPDERVELGKSRNGTIRLTAAQAGGLVHITISDDGRGLDFEKTRLRAVEAGLAEPDAQLSEDAIVSFLFASGFSTADAITEVSGRGVGLDVVKRTLEGLNGSISISSEQGQGTRIRLSVPLTMAIIDGLLATVGTERYVIPLAVVESCAEADQPDVWREHGRDVLDVHGSLVPLVRLREFFGVDGLRPAEEIAVICVIDGKRFGIVVDAVQDTIQAVIKSFGHYVGRAEGLTGTTVLGDGSAVAVVDPGDLLHAAETAG